MDFNVVSTVRYEYNFSTGALKTKQSGMKHFLPPEEGEQMKIRERVKFIKKSKKQI